MGAEPDPYHRPVIPAIDETADADVVLAVATTVRAVELGDELVLVDERTGRTCALNASGALVWACLDGEATVGEICRDLADGLAVPYEVVFHDVRDIARRWLDEELVKVANSRSVDREDPCCGDPHHGHRDDPRLLAEPPNY